MIRISGYVYPRKRKRTIYYLVITENGNIVENCSTGTTKKREAEELLKQRLEVSRRQSYGFKDTNAQYLQHFKDFLNLYKIGSQTHKTYKGYLKLFTEFMQDKYPRIQYLHEFAEQPKLFDDYKIWLKQEKMTPEGKPHKDCTVKNHLKGLKTVFHQAREWRFIIEVPTINNNISINDSKQIVALNKEEDFDLFFQRCKKMKPEYYPHYFVAVRTGLRFGEMCNLTWDDVDLKKNCLIVKARGDFAPKGRNMKTGQPKERTVPLTQDAIEALRALPRSKTCNNVFLKDGEPISPKDKSFRRWILAIVRGTRLEGMTRFHELRHTTGHILADSGVDKGVIKDFLGHSDIRTTERYTGKPLRPLMEASKKLEGFGKV